MNNRNNLKTCRKCGHDYPLDEFYPSKVNKDGRVSYCKECYKAKVALYSKTRQFIPKTDGVKICRICSMELPIAEFGIAHHLVDGRSSECKKCINAKAKKKDKESIHAASKRWKDKHKDELLRYQRIWQANNKAWIHTDRKRRYIQDINYRIAEILRSRVRLALKGKLKVGRTMELLGCSVDELKKMLEAKFVPGMTWGNYGQNGWHIDHIIPCASFDLKDGSEQKACFHFSNLQPLWAKDNRVKGCRITKDILLT